MSLKSLPSNPAFSHSQPTDAQNATTSASGPHIPAEFEQTLTLLTSHRSVLGYLLLSRSQPVTIIRHSGVVFEGEQGRKYAHAVGRIVESVQTGLEEVAGDSTDTVCLSFIHITPQRFIVSSLFVGRNSIHENKNKAS